MRFAALAGALVVGVGLGVAFIPYAHTWEHKNPAGHDGRAGIVRVAWAVPPGAGRPLTGWYAVRRVAAPPSLRR